MNSFLAWLGAALVVVLGALFAVPHFVDWNGYRGVLEEEASRVLGREVRVGGAVNVRLLPVPYLAFERLRVADPSSFSGEPLFRAESVTMWLAVPPLLRGVLEANQVELRRPEIRVAVDRNGVANWSQVKIHKGELPFVPADVALRAVSIVDGRLSLDIGSSGEIARLDDIDGTLSGEAFDGPYKFAGTAKWDGAAREVKLATARPDADGGLRFKTTVRVPANGNSYVLDGRVGDIAGHPTLGGEVSARIDLAASGTIIRVGPASATAVGVGERPVLDVKGRVDGDLGQLRLSGIVASFENIGQPQLVEGEAKATWGEAPSLAVTLASKWLDVDSLAGAGAAAQPVSTALAVADTFLATLATEGRVDARLSVDQVSIGGDTVSGLGLSLRRDGGAEPRTTLRASLPGGTNFDLAGTVARRDGRSQFKGPVMLGGSSLQRLLAWATRNEAMSRSFPDGPFAVQGQLSLDPAAVSLDEARGEMAGTPLKGSITVEHGPRRRLRVELAGKRVDTAWLWPGGGIGTLGALLLPHARDAGTRRPQTSAGWLDAADTDIAIRLQAGRLVDGARTLEEVAADITLAGGNLAISRLAFAGAGRLAVDLEGTVTRDASRPLGELRGVVAAPTAEAVTLLSELIAVDDALPEAGKLARSLAPLDLAATIRLAAADKGAFDLVLDGIAGGGRLVARLRLDALGSGWRNAPTTASVALSEMSIAGLLARMVASDSSRNALASADRAGTLRIDAAGVPTTGMLTAASVASEDLTIALDGRSKLTPAGWLDVEGEATVGARDARVLLALVGLDAKSAVGTPIAGPLAITRRDGQLTLRPKGVALAGARLSGEVGVTRAHESGVARLDADLSLDAARISGLLAIVTEPAQDGAAGAVSGDGPASLWPERTFRNPLVDGLTGRIRLAVGALEFGPGLGVGNATIEAAIEPRRITVSRLEGVALGGRLTGSGVIAKAAAGAEVSGSLSLDGARIEALAGGARSRARGPVSLKLGFTGQALSPRGLVGALKGKGEAALGAAEIDGLTPDAIGRAADAVLAGRAGAAGHGLVATIRSELGQGRLPLGPSAIPITIVDGALRLAATTIETQSGRTTIETTVDLGNLHVDSQWQIEAKAMKPARGLREGGLWPPVQVVYVGPLGAIDGIEPQVGAAAFERELTVRRMELEVDELERLRRLDEERVRQERERQRRIEEERARAAASEANTWTPSATSAPPLPPAGAGPASVVPPQPGAAVDSAPLPPVAEPANPPAATTPAPAVASPQPRPPRPRPRRTPSAAETTLQGLMPPGVQ
ncbi:MAG: AsmA family protein [Pseudomonadota bacterium]